MRPGRGGNDRRGSLVRTLLSYGAVAVTCGWAGYSYHDRVAPSSNAQPILMREETPESKSATGAEWGGEPTTRAPWDPQGCQTIAFFHVPKTGGESINELQRGGDTGWKEGYTWTSLRKTGLDLKQQEVHLRSMKPWLRESPKQRHKLVEFHCGDALSFMQAREVLETMRSEHKKNDCGFFAFTMIRPPLDWLVSLYDDICHRRLRGHKDTCPQQESMTSKEEMLAYPHRDGLVSYLTHGFKGWDSPGPVDDSAVKELVEALREHLDLVALTNEVPQIRKYLTERFAAPNGLLTPEAESALARGAMQNANGVKTIHLSDFNPEELAQLNSTVQLDWMLYEAVLADHQSVRL